MLFGQVALLICALFAGAAFYVNLAEQPARLALDDRAMLTQWKIAYKRGAAMQAPLALIGFVLGSFAWYRSGRHLFLAGAAFMITNWPWTLLVIRPVNKQLMATPVEEAGAETRRQIQEWNDLHAVRTVLSLLAVVAVLLALVH